ncbi:MAG TPA: hypothetical protein VGO22_12220, partial [Pseudorhizobium sp.]|nr:hypothetical protein [Pseudorhizobium sp.]
ERGNDPTSGEHRPWRFLLWAVAGTAVFVAIGIATQGVRGTIASEAGSIEIASPLLYAYAAIVWLWTRPGETWRCSWELPAIMFLMAGREFDLDKKLTSVGILKSNLYLTDMAPVTERILGLVALAAVATVAVRIIKLHAKPFINGLLALKLWAWAVAFGAGFAVVSKSIDGIGRKLAPFGITVDGQTEAMMVVAEELLEFGVPVMFLVAVVASFRRNRPTDPQK